MKKNNRGLSLPEVIVMAAIIGMVGILAPAIVNMLNSLKYQQEVSEINTEARNFMRQIMHEIRNAAAIDFIENTNTAYPYVTDCIGIKSFDLQRYKEPTNKTWENSDMFNEEDPGFAGKNNYIVSYYCIYDEAAGPSGFDFNGNNKQDRYLLKASLVPEQGNGGYSLEGASTAKIAFQTMLTNINIPNVPANFMDFDNLTRKAFFTDKVKLDGVLTFNQVTSETYKIELRIFPPFLKPGSPPRTYIGMANMRSRNES